VMAVWLWPGAVLLVASVVLTFAGASGAPPAPVAWDAIDVVALLLAGGWLLQRRRGALTGPLLLLTGLAIGISVLTYVDDAPGLRLVGMIALPLFAPPLMLALLGFPDGRARGIDRWLWLGALAACTAGWWAVLATYEPPVGGIATVAMPFADRSTFEVLGLVHWAACALLGPVIAARLVLRWMRSTPAARRVHLPLVVSGAATALVTGSATPFALEVLDGRPPPDAVLAAWGVGFAIVPATVGLTLLRRRGVRAPVTALLAAGSSLRDAVAEALGDPTLELVERGPLPAAAGRDRAITPLGGQGALVHDPALLEDPVLLETVAHTAGLVLEHERLTAEVRAQLEEASAIRRRIVHASDDARRGIERDLHDGAQQTLVSLALALAMLQEELADEHEVAGRLVAHAASQAEAALRELRDLARGVFPALLSADGLGPALEELAAASPLQVGLDLRLAGRVAPEVEAAAWFLVREGLANAAEHGRARGAVVRATEDGGRLEVEVLDDGAGGAAVVRSGALEGLADRVVALGGELEVGEAPGGGTRLAARFDGAATRPAPPAASAPRAVPSG
jgi:signal transduction histidine kinase